MNSAARQSHRPSFPVRGCALRLHRKRVREGRRASARASTSKLLFVLHDDRTLTDLTQLARNRQSVLGKSMPCRKVGTTFWVGSSAGSEYRQLVFGEAHALG